MSSKSKRNRQPTPLRHAARRDSQTKWPEESEGILFQNYVVGFFDLLGTKERMTGLRSAWQRQMSAGDDKPTEEMIETSKRLAQPLVALRRSFKEFFEGFTRLGDADRSILMTLDTATARSFQSALTPKLSIAAFGDSVIVHFPLKDPGSSWFQFRALLGLLASVGASSAMLARRGLLLRGGIAMGCGVEFYRGEIYGPVLAEAYELECKTAKMPRVVVGSHLVDFLREVAAHAPNLPQTRIEAGMAERALELISLASTEAPPLHFVDYARYAPIRSELQRVSPTFLNDTLAALERAKSDAPTAVHEKYDYLIEYMRHQL